MLFHLFNFIMINPSIVLAIFMFNILVKNKLIPGLDLWENYCRVFNGFLNAEELYNRKKTFIRY